jgi:tRNA 2-thiouridine synthesizing protein A
MPPDADIILDASGLLCPLPVVKARKALDAMLSGQVLRLITTDPASVSDVRALAKRSGDELLAEERAGTTFVFSLRKA